MGVRGLPATIADVAEVVKFSDLSADHLQKTGRSFRMAADEKSWIKTCLSDLHDGIVGATSADHIDKATVHTLLRLIVKNIDIVIVFDGAHHPFKPHNSDGYVVRRDRLKDLCFRGGIKHRCGLGDSRAECAKMEECGVVDAVWSNTLDAFLFGAQTVIQPHIVGGQESHTHILVYRASRLEANYKLDRAGLVLFALLSGRGPENPGVKNCGPDLALEAVRYNNGILSKKLQNINRLELEKPGNSFNKDMLEFFIFRASKSIVRFDTWPDAWPNPAHVQHYAWPMVSRSEDCLKPCPCFRGNASVAPESLKSLLTEGFHFDKRDWVRTVLPALLARSYSQNWSAVPAPTNRDRIKIILAPGETGNGLKEFTITFDPVAFAGRIQQGQSIEQDSTVIPCDGTPEDLRAPVTTTMLRVVLKKALGTELMARLQIEAKSEAGSIGHNSDALCRSESGSKKRKSITMALNETANASKKQKGVHIDPRSAQTLSLDSIPTIRKLGQMQCVSPPPSQQLKSTRLRLEYLNGLTTDRMMRILWFDIEKGLSSKLSWIPTFHSEHESSLRDAIDTVESHYREMQMNLTEWETLEALPKCRSKIDATILEAKEFQRMVLDDFSGSRTHTDSGRGEKIVFSEVVRIRRELAIDGMLFQVYLTESCGYNKTLYHHRSKAATLETSLGEEYPEHAVDFERIFEVLRVDMSIAEATLSYVPDCTSSAMQYPARTSHYHAGSGETSSMESSLGKDPANEATPEMQPEQSSISQHVSQDNFDVTRSRSASQSSLSRQETLSTVSRESPTGSSRRLKTKASSRAPKSGVEKELERLALSLRNQPVTAKRPRPLGYRPVPDRELITDISDSMTSDDSSASQGSQADSEWVPGRRRDRRRQRARHPPDRFRGGTPDGLSARPSGERDRVALCDKNSPSSSSRHEGSRSSGRGTSSNIQRSAPRSEAEDDSSDAEPSLHGRKGPSGRVRVEVVIPKTQTVAPRPNRNNHLGHHPKLQAENMMTTETAQPGNHNRRTEPDLEITTNDTGSDFTVESEEDRDDTEDSHGPETGNRQSEETEATYQEHVSRQASETSTMNSIDSLGSSSVTSVSINEKGAAPKKAAQKSIQGSNEHARLERIPASMLEEIQRMVQETLQEGLRLVQQEVKQTMRETAQQNQGDIRETIRKEILPAIEQAMSQMHDDLTTRLEQTCSDCMSPLISKMDGLPDLLKTSMGPRTCCPSCKQGSLLERAAENAGRRSLQTTASTTAHSVPATDSRDGGSTINSLRRPIRLSRQWQGSKTTAMLSSADTVRNNPYGTNRIQPRQSAASSEERSRHGETARLLPSSRMPIEEMMTVTSSVTSGSSDSGGFAGSRPKQYMDKRSTTSGTSSSISQPSARTKDALTGTQEAPGLEQYRIAECFIATAISQSHNQNGIRDVLRMPEDPTSAISGSSQSQGGVASGSSVAEYIDLT